MRKALVVMLTGIFIFLFIGLALSSPVDLFLPYQKTVTTALTGSASTKNVEVTFSLWNAQTGGNELWSETKPIAANNATRTISTKLGNTVPLDGTDFSQQLWVQVQANGKIYGSRDKLSVVPYALWSATGGAGSQVGAYLTGKVYQLTCTNVSTCSCYKNASGVYDLLLSGGAACINYPGSNGLRTSYPESTASWMATCQNTNTPGQDMVPNEIYITCLTTATNP